MILVHRLTAAEQSRDDLLGQDNIPQWPQVPTMCDVIQLLAWAAIAASTSYITCLGSPDEGKRGEQKSWLKTQHSKNQDHGFQSINFMKSWWGIKVLGSYNRKKESKMAVAKRQRKEKPAKMEKKKIWGLEWEPQVKQTTLLAGPIYTGRAWGRIKNI